MHHDIWIYAETGKSELSSRVKELLGAGRKIADQLDEKVCCVLLTDDLGDSAREAIAYGADTVYTLEDERFKAPQTDLCLQVLKQIAEEHEPRVMLLGRSPADLAPRLALQLDVGLAAECVDLEVGPDEQSLRMTRSVYGGNAHAVFSSTRYPQIATLRPKAIPALDSDDSRRGEIVTLDPSIDVSAVKIEVIERKIEAEGSRRLEEADAIVCGGRGMGAGEPFLGQLKALADVLGGVVGASRPPADDGWVPAALHIGLTGKVVAPNIYVAVGVSGASQHIAGCSSAKTIIAVNKDPEAYIFKHADYGIVGRWEDVLPALTEKLKEIKAV